MPKILNSQIVEFAKGVKAAIVSPFTAEQMYDGNSQRDRVTGPQEVFAHVPLLNRAFNLRCDGLQRVPAQWYDGDKAIDDWPFEDSIPFAEWLWRAEADNLGRGASFTLVLKDAAGDPTGQIQQLNPYTIYVERQPFADPQTGQTRLVNSFWQQLPQGRYPVKGDYWHDDEMIYIKGFNPSDDIGPGISASMVALRSAQVQHYLSQFFAQYFEAGAMPTLIIGMPSNTESSEVNRVENWFKQRINGIRRAFGVIAVSGETKPQFISPKLTELELEKLRQSAILEISSAFGVPKTLLTSDSANYATAVTEYRTFAAYTLAGRTAFYERHLNRFFQDYGYRIEFDIQALPEMQEDEAQRSQAFRNYVEGGMSPVLASNVLGVNIPEKWADEWNNTPDAGKPHEPVTVTLPRSYDIQNPGTLETEQPPDKQASETKTELDRWQRKALRRLAEGKSPSVEFKSAVVPAEAYYAIAGKLACAVTPQDVRDAFTEPQVLIKEL